MTISLNRIIREAGMVARAFMVRVPKTGSPLETELCKKKKAILIRLLFGKKKGWLAKDKHMLNVYRVLSELYTSEEDSLFFDFNGIILPKPNTEQHQSCLSTEVSDFIIYHLLDDVNFCDAITYEGPYEYKSVQISAGDIVIDAGANMGGFSALASRKGATVYAFEPMCDIVENYLSLCALHNPNINIFQYALSNCKDMQEFTVSTNIGGGTLVTSEMPSQDTSSKVTVQTISLDEFVRENTPPRIDFIKADIEGAERLMLMGAKNVLRDFAPKLAICTYHLPDDPKVLRKLILDANPNYVIEEKFRKMYAWVPRR